MRGKPMPEGSSKADTPTIVRLEFGEKCFERKCRLGDAAKVIDEMSTHHSIDGAEILTSNTAEGRHRHTGESALWTILADR